MLSLRQLPIRGGGLRGTAEEGFWTGGPIPLGYESRTVELRGKKEKKKLFIRDDEAQVVRLIFDMASGATGPAMGGRAIADYLNAHGYAFRGRKFFNSNVAGILARTHYTGQFAGNRFGFDGKLLPEDEWTWVTCPSIISQEQFDRVAALMETRAPRNVAPRMVNSPTLLIGLARCGIEGCGSGMTIRTGKGGRYRYYTCHARTNRGAKSCGCPSVRAEQLDELVMRELAEKLFLNDRLEGLLQRVLDFSDEARGRKLEEIARCEDRIASARRRLGLLYDGIEAETLSARDPDIAARIKSHRAEIDALNQKAKTLRQQVERGPARITPTAVQRFGEIVRDRLVSGDQPERQQIVRAFVKQVRVGPRQVTIHGEKDALAHGVAVVARSKGAVPIFDREWCPEEGSHPNHKMMISSYFCDDTFEKTPKPNPLGVFLTKLARNAPTNFNWHSLKVQRQFSL